jgi:hypothetical protein
MNTASLSCFSCPSSCGIEMAWFIQEVDDVPA